MKYNTTDLIREAHESTGLTLKDTTTTIETFLEKVADHLIDGDDVNLKRIGKLCVVTRQPRSGTAPGGEPYSLPERQAIAFKISDPLAEAIQA